MGRQLENFLEEQANSGENAGEAHFTLNTEAALRKLGKSQLPSPWLWVVKMVQAAVAGGSPDIRFIYGKDAVLVRFQLRETFSASEIIQRIGRSETLSQGFWPHLAAALRVLFSPRFVSWSLECQTSEGGQRCRWQNDKLEEQDSEAVGIEGTQLTVTISRPVRVRFLNKGQVESNVRRTLEEQFQLRKHAWCAPIPVNIDGLEIPRGYHSPHQFTPHNGKNAPFCVALAELEAAKVGPYLPALLTTKTHRQSRYYPMASKVSKVSTKRLSSQAVKNKQSPPFLSWPSETSVCSSALGFYLTGNSEPHSKLIFICDGVAIQEVPLTFFRRWNDHVHTSEDPTPRGSFRIYLPVESRELDLSSFGVDQVDERRLLALKEHLDVFRQFLESLETHREEFITSDPPPGRRPWLEWGIVGIGVATATVLPWSMGVLGFKIGGGLLTTTLLGMAATLERDLDSLQDTIQIWTRVLQEFDPETMPQKKV